MLPPLTAVAHELRTPLHGMLGLVALLRDTPLDAEQRAHVDALDEAARALLALAEDALELARLDAGTLVPRLAPCAPVAIAEGVARTAAPLAAARGLALAVIAAPDAPAEATLDAGRVRQVLLNLVGNAVRVTTRGGVTLRVRADGADGADGVVYEVADTGPGLSAARRAALWTAWDRAAAPTPTATAGEGGAGLGLGLSRALAEAMGGTLAADGAPGAGSTFTLRLPRRPQASAGAQLNPLAAHADTRP